MNLKYATERFKKEQELLASATSPRERAIAYALVKYWQFKVQQYRDGRNPVPSEKGEGDILPCGCRWKDRDLCQHGNAPLA